MRGIHRERETQQGSSRQQLQSMTKALTACVPQQKLRQRMRNFFRYKLEHKVCTAVLDM